MTQLGVVLLNMDMEPPKSDVNSPKKKVRFWHILINIREAKTPKNKFKNV